MTMFLDADDLVVLTGRPQKSQQIKALRKMAIPFYVNAVGKPVVARAVLEGRRDDSKPVKKKWEPKD